MASKNLQCGTESYHLPGFVQLKEAEPKGGQVETVERVEKDPITAKELSRLKDDIMRNLLNKDKQEVWSSFQKSLLSSRILKSGDDTLTGLLKIEGDGYARKPQTKPNERRVYLQGYSNVIFLQAVLTKLMTDDPALNLSSPGDLDGQWGKNTEDALRSFQKSQGLKQDGQFGPKTFEAFQNYFATSEPPVRDTETVTLESTLKTAVDEGMRKLKKSAPEARHFTAAIPDQPRYHKETTRIHFPLLTDTGKLVYLEVEGSQVVLEREKLAILQYLNKEWK